MSIVTEEPTPSGGSMITRRKSDSYNGGEQNTETQLDADGNYMGRMTEHGIGTGETPGIPGTGNFMVNDDSDHNMGVDPIKWDGSSNPANSE